MRSLLPALLVALALAACGQTAKDKDPLPDASVAADASAPSDASEVGDASVDGDAGADPEIWYVACWSFEDIANEGTGDSPCPRFHQIVFEEPPGACVWEVAQEEAVEPPPGETGDCCYEITYHECR